MELGDVDVAYNLAIEGLKRFLRPRCRFMLGVRTIARIFMLKIKGYIRSGKRTGS